MVQLNIIKIIQTVLKKVTLGRFYFLYEFYSHGDIFCFFHCLKGRNYSQKKFWKETIEKVHVFRVNLGEV